MTFNVSTGYKGLQGFEKRYEEEPLEFILGGHQMIPGFEVGLQEMCAGEIRHISVPEQYGYGGNGLGGLPSRATYYFFAKMVSFESLPAENPVNTFKLMDMNGDNSLTHDEIKAYLIKAGYQDEAGDHGIKQMMRDIFREEDRDSNGYITHQEFSGPKHDYV